MLRYITAEWIFPVSSSPIKNGIVVINDRGEIQKVLTPDEVPGAETEIERHAGAIVPGFINTHCHLELSHMRNQIPEKTGLVGFVQTIIKSRQADGEEITAAMQDADLQMLANGIVAVGDISNQVISKEIKQNSKIYYHTFVEAMGFNPERAEAIMDYAKGIKQEFEPLPASVAPHAPYSVSTPLFELISLEAEKTNSLITIHNQETTQENSFFEDKSGGFLELYKFLGLDISFFEPTGKTSLQSYLPYLKDRKTLLVHNTVSKKDDVGFARETNTDLYWCLCPQANLYIEDQLPNVSLLMEEGVKITLGTDSLASNHQLNILSEMKTLQQHKNVDFERLLLWATKNGAEFLGLDNRLGTIEAGKTPGLNLIQLIGNFEIENDKVIKLV